MTNIRQKFTLDRPAPTRSKCLETSMKVERIGLAECRSKLTGKKMVYRSVAWQGKLTRLLYRVCCAGFIPWACCWFQFT